MSGAFAEWQPRYAAHRVATFPVTADKVPAVKGYLRVGMRASEQLSMKFAGHDAFGFACRSNRITVLDVDTPDERVLADALSQHGQTPFIVRSGSGNFQAWFRNNGEKRKVRPDPEKPIDILGDGFVVAPPSLARKGRYEIVQGTLDDLERLPKMRSFVEPVPPPAPSLEADCQLNGLTTTAIDPVDHKRNDTLFRHCMRVAKSCGTLRKLMDTAMDHNNEFYRPLPTEEVLRIVASAWGYEVQGENHFNYGPRVVLDVGVVDDLAAADPRAFALISILRRHHDGANSFILANAMATSLGWDLRAFRTARDLLLERGLIVCLHRGGRGANDPPIYRLAS